MTRFALVILFCGLVVATASVSPAFGQERHETLAVVERTESGHTIYELIGTGFPEGQRVRIDAVNVALHEGNTFVVTSTAAGFAGVFIGKTATGDYVPVMPGVWKVRAKCGSAVARARFTVGRGGNIATGQWGGRHVGIVVTDHGATLEWDCAHGTMDHPIVLGPSGQFDVTGVHVREHGGPVRQGEAEDSHPARYTGTVVDDTMTLTVVLTDTNESLGTYTLVRGAAPQVFKCA